VERSRTSFPRTSGRSRRLPCSSAKIDIVRPEHAEAGSGCRAALMAPESHIAVFWGTAHAGPVDRSNWSTSMVGEFRLRSPPRRGPEEHAQERTPWRPSSNSRASPEPERALRSAYGLGEAPVPWTRDGDRRRSSGSRANLGVRSTSRSRRPLTRAAGPRGMWGRKVRYCAYLAGNSGMTLSPGGRDAGLE
jgi:hypothetical protein